MHVGTRVSPIGALRSRITSARAPSTETRFVSPVASCSSSLCGPPFWWRVAPWATDGTTNAAMAAAAARRVRVIDGVLGEASLGMQSVEAEEVVFDGRDVDARVAGLGGELANRFGAQDRAQSS